MAFPLIDVHAHYLPPFYRQALADAGHLPGPDGFHTIPEWSAEDHLAHMKANNIRKSYLSISSPGIFLTQPTPGDNRAAAAAASLARRVNEYGSALKREHPSEFGFFASLPLPDIAASLEEIDYCMSSLSPDGFCILSNAFGLYLGDSRMAPIYEKLSACHSVIFVHPTLACTAQNAFSANPSSASTEPVPPPARLAANMPLAESYSAPMLEFLFDSTRTFSDIMLTGTATRYQSLRWIVPHCGATLPSILDRIVRFSQVLPSKAGSMRTVAPLTEAKVRELLGSQFYFDLAGLPMNSQIHHMMRWIDHTRFLFGSDVPFTAWKISEVMVDEIRQELTRIFGVETGAHEIRSVCCGNAEALFSST